MSLWINAAPGVIERPELVPAPQQTDRGQWLVTVYNNDHNTYEEVMTILMIATQCDADEAYVEAWEIDHMGFCVVHQGKEDRCRQAAQIISTIGIRVEVTEDD